MQTHKKVLSLSDVRLASTKGHVVLVPANEPTLIPAALFLEAAKCGCFDYSEEMLEALKAAVAKAEAVEPEDKPEPIDFMKFAREAVRQTLSAGKSAPQLLNSAGLPRLPAVRAAYRQILDNAQLKSDLKITSALVDKLVLEVTDEAKPSPLAKDADDEFGGDLEGEEVGGDIEAVLARVQPQDEE